MNDLSKVREGYDRWSAIYDHDANPLLALEEPVIKTVVGDVRGRTILDAGCGTGRHASWMAASGGRVTAIDFSPQMLGIARSKPYSDIIRFLCHDLHKGFPLADQIVDLVVSGLVIEHLNDLGHFFREIRRVSKPAGEVVVSAMHPSMFLLGSQARFTDSESGLVIQPGSIPHRMGEIVMAFLNAGIQLLRIEEVAPDEAFARQYPRATKYIGWPMLLVLHGRC